MEILDSDFQPENNKRIFFMSVKAFYLLIGAITALNIFLIYAEMSKNDREKIHIDIFFSLFLPLIMLPILSFVLAIFFALVPYRGKSYKQKYIPVAGFFLILLNILVFILYGMNYFLPIIFQTPQ